MKQKIKVAIVYHFIPHYREAIFNKLCCDENGDIEYCIAADEVSNLPALKVLTSSESSSGAYISKRWKKLKNVWITKDILWQKGLLKLSLSQDYDAYILLGNMYYISTWLAVFLAKIRGKKVYFWTHGYRNEEKGFKGSARYLFYLMADGLFLYGNRAKDILIKKGYSATKLHVIYNCLDYKAQLTELENVCKKDRECIKQQLKIRKADKIIIENFYDFVSKRKKPICSYFDAFKTIKLVEYCKRACLSGRQVKII